MMHGLQRGRVRKMRGAIVFALLLAAPCALTATTGAPPVRSEQADRSLNIVATVDRGRQPSAPTPSSQTAYLLVYFKEHVHSLHFATSRDGYTFTDVNDGKPVLLGKDIAAQKGIRDPYLMRGPDGAFYMTMTDLHIYAKQEGLRSTAWERPQKEYGWGNNRAIVLMRSRDLIHWTHARVDLTSAFPAWKEMGIAWAPQVIYDPIRRKMMVYFSTRIRTGRNSLVYAYADPTFRTLTAAPKPLFSLADRKKSAVDGDITQVDGRYHLFVSTDDGSGNIRQAVSDRIDGGYVYDPTKVDPEAVGTEAPTIWRRYGTDTYVLMYDVYAAKPNNMGFSETTDFRTFRTVGHFNAPGSPMKTTNFNSPKHGSVTAITPAEADRLEHHFAGR